MTPRAGAARAQQSSHVMQSNVAEAVHRTAADGRKGHALLPRPTCRRLLTQKGANENTVHGNSFMVGFKTPAVGMLRRTRKLMRRARCRSSTQATRTVLIGGAHGPGARLRISRQCRSLCARTHT